MPTKGALNDLLAHPLLVAVIMAAFAGYAGYINGQAATTSELRALTGRMAKAEAGLARLSRTSHCTTRTLDRLSDKTGVMPPCRIEGDQ